jgi:hypothetical protein
VPRARSATRMSQSFATATREPAAASASNWPGAVKLGGGSVDAAVRAWLAAPKPPPR